MAFINCTLIVQAFNFFIAFLLIKYLFFKPVLTQIRAEDTLQESLIAAVQEHQILVAAQEQALKEHWRSVRAYFSANTPSLKLAPIFSKRPDISIPHYTMDELGKAAQEAANILIKKVDHGA